MPNSDIQDGVHNKITKEYRIVKADGGWSNSANTEPGDSFNGAKADPEVILDPGLGGDVDTAKNYFLTTNALANFDTDATQVSFAITADGKGLKWTAAFGTKGAGTAEGDDWAALFKARKDELIAARDWIKGEYDATEKDKGNDSAGSGVRHVAWKDGEPYTWEAKDISDSHLF